MHYNDINGNKLLVNDLVIFNYNNLFNFGKIVGFSSTFPNIVIVEIEEDTYSKYIRININFEKICKIESINSIDAMIFMLNW